MVIHCMPANTGQTDALNTGRFRIIWNGWQPYIKCKRELTRGPPSVRGPGHWAIFAIQINDKKYTICYVNMLCLS